METQRKSETKRDICGGKLCVLAIDKVGKLLETWSWH